MSMEGLHEEIVALQAEYSPLLDEATQKDEIAHGGKLRRDGEEEWNKVYREYLEKYRAIRAKYGIRVSR